MDRGDSSPFYMIFTDDPNTFTPLHPTETCGRILERERVAILEIADKFSTSVQIRDELMRSEPEMVRQLGGELLLRLIEVVTGRSGEGNTDRVPVP